MLTNAAFCIKNTVTVIMRDTITNKKLHVTIVLNLIYACLRSQQILSCVCDSIHTIENKFTPDV